MGKALIAGCILLALGGCQTGGGSFCAVMTGADGEPILRPSAGDVEAVSDQLAAGLVTTLETGKKLCGWKP